MHARILALASFFVTAPLVSWANVVINELEPDPPGPDAGKEWLELYNASDSPVSLAGWRIESGTSSYAVRHTFGAGVQIPARGFLVVGGEDVPFADVVSTGLTLGNATSSTDAVRIVNASHTVIDTVVYGTPNTHGWLDDTGAVATSFAPMPGAGKTIGRKVDGADTNQSGDDFIVLAVASPGASNGSSSGGGGGGGACTPASAADGLVINEFLPDPVGPDDQKEWVELYNGSGGPVNLEGYRLESGTRTYSLAASFPAGLTLSAGAFYVVGGSLVPESQLPLTGVLGNATSTSDAVRLVDCNATPVDTVVYGSPNTGESDPQWRDDTGAIATSLAPKPPAGASLARRVDGVDTDQSGADFIVQPDITPGGPNPSPGSCSSGYVVINEFLPDPPGADQGQEWIELYNPGSQSINLNGWVIDAHTRQFGGGVPLPDVTIAAGGFLVLGHVGVDFADVSLGFLLGNATSNSDGVQLRDCNGLVIDTVIYGSPNTDEWVDDTGLVATSLAPKAGAGVSLARIEDGYDTDLSGEDFVTEVAPTPGAPNRIVEPVICVPAAAVTVVLNELMVNPDGRDEGFEWIELFNPTQAPISVAGWGISWATRADNISIIDAVIPGGTSVPAGGFLVLGDEFVDEADVELRLRLPNGTNGDGVILFDCDGNRIDTVIYGPNNTDMITDDLGDVVEPYIRTVASGASLARRVDGVDTDTAADWFSASRPTPGASNGGTGGGPQEPGRGCGRRRSAVTPAAFIGFIGLLGWVRRRRA